jgi:hydrogenase maturation protease
MTRTKIIGVGNPFLTDDAAGIRVVRLAREMAQGCGNTGDISFDEVYAGGLRLMDALEGFKKAIIVDAIIVENARPGRAYFLSEGDFSAARNLECTHDTDLVSALELGRACGMALPSDIKVLAVEVEAENTGIFGESLTPEVEAALPTAARMVITELWRTTPDGVFNLKNVSGPDCASAADSDFMPDRASIADSPFMTDSASVADSPFMTDRAFKKSARPIFQKESA